MIGRDVIDVLLDHDLDQDHCEDVARRLEEPLVVPAVLPLKRPRYAVVLPQEEDGHDHESDLQVARVTAHGEELTPLIAGDLVVAYKADPVELLVPALVQVRGVLLSVDGLVLQEPTLASAQLPGDLVGEPIDLHQIDLVVGLVLGDVTDGLTRIGIAHELVGAGVPPGALAAEEPVDEPLREVGEQHRRLLAGRRLPLPVKESGNVLRRGMTWLFSLGRWKVATVIGPVGREAQDV